MPVVLGQHIDRSYHELDHRFALVDAPVHPLSRQLLAYWETCEAKGGMRMGRDVPSRAIASLLGNIVIYEPHADWTDAHMRYAGFATAKYFGRDITGLLFSEVAAENRDGSLKQLFSQSRSLLHEKRPRILEHTLLSDGVELERQELVIFPVFAAVGDERWIFSAAFDF